MQLRTLVWRELFERKNQLATSFIAILLGVSVIVSIENITVYSEKAVAKELDALGANVLILPKSASLQGYYSADMHSEEIPEEYVVRLVLSDLQGLDNLLPKYSTQVMVAGQNVTLTGILPHDELAAKAAWGGGGVFARPSECTGVPVKAEADQPKETQFRRKLIQKLDKTEIYAGAEAAAALNLKTNDTVQLQGQKFTVSTVLPMTGTVDDSRLFTHLHTVQKLAGKGPVLNAVEVVGCCKEISRGLVQKINKLLPDAKVVTITQIVETQLKTNRMMTQLSWLFLGIIVIVGGASMANYMYANVYERRREIGTLMALGAGSSFVLRIFLLKALLLGIGGGLMGYILGTAMAVVLGPKIAGVPVMPLPWLVLLATGVAVALALVATYFPARRAARMDPSAALRES
ncbi:MAG TPA: FtsX-like permease family protein [Planctomycetota bacterium]|jgi:putative ABC transport system permease protein